MEQLGDVGAVGRSSADVARSSPAEQDLSPTTKQPGAPEIDTAVVDDAAAAVEHWEIEPPVVGSEAGGDSTVPIPARGAGRSPALARPEHASAGTARGRRHRRRCAQPSRRGGRAAGSSSGRRVRTCWQRAGELGDRRRRCRRVAPTIATPCSAEVVEVDRAVVGRPDQLRRRQVSGADESSISSWRSSRMPAASVHQKMSRPR